MWTESTKSRVVYSIGGCLERTMLRDHTRWPGSLLESLCREWWVNPMFWITGERGFKGKFFFVSKGKYWKTKNSLVGGGEPTKHGLYKYHTDDKKWRWKTGYKYVLMCLENFYHKTFMFSLNKFPTVIILLRVLMNLYYKLLVFRKFTLFIGPHDFRPCFPYHLFLLGLRFYPEVLGY